MHGALRPRTVGRDENTRMHASAHRINCSKWSTRTRAILIDRRAEHNSATDETSMADAAYSMAVYACEDHLLIDLMFET